MSPANPNLGSGRSFIDEDPIDEDPVVNDIQNIVRTGYIKSSRRVYLVRFGQPQTDTFDKLLSFANFGIVPLPSYPEEDIVVRLSSLIEKLSNEKSGVALDFGLTFTGLEKLKVRAELLEVFKKKSPAFHDNAYSRAQKHLGDTGLSSPEQWALPYRNQDSEGGFHLALIAHFPYNSKANPPQENSECICVFENQLAIALRVLPEDSILISPLSGDWIEVSVPLSQPEKEHFGYRDGITAPVYSKAAPERDDKGYRELHAMGEILLGYPRNEGENRYALLDLTRKKNPQIGLQETPIEEEKKQFFRNSSFAVLRKMEQRVEVFEKWVDSQAKALFLQTKSTAPAYPEDPYALSKKWIRSKLMGRTPEGVLLTPKMELKDIQDDSLAQSVEAKLTAQPGSETRFHDRDAQGAPTISDDSQGRGCPFSSHIRRMNPRDYPVTPFIHRPLIRRGMTYTQNGATGMSGLFICADLVDQFEHLVGVWGNGRVSGIPDDSTCRDPLIGNHEPQNNVLYLNSREHGGASNAVRFDEPFVVTKGCAYIWFPSVSVIKKFKSFTNPFAK